MVFSDRHKAGPVSRGAVTVFLPLSLQEEGELIVEGLLNIYWGLRRPIRLQMQDDNERIRPPPSSTSWHSGCNLDAQRLVPILLELKPPKVSYFWPRVNGPIMNDYKGLQ